jgi:predicted transcriptional regulator
MANPAKPPLSDLENTVMAVIWERGQATAEQVRMALEDAQPMKDSTARTILRRLEQKGYVRHEIEGRTYVYSPTVGSRSVAADAVRGIIDRFCNGSVEDLLVGMVDGEVVSPEKLRLLAQRIARSTKRAGAEG